MQQQAAATRQTRPAIQKRGVPTVRMIAGQPGHYLVSSSQPGHAPYHVDACAGTCTCEAFVQWAKTCRHIKAAAVVWSFHLRQRLMRETAPTTTTQQAPQRLPRPAVGMQQCAGCGRTRWGLLTEEAWCACQQTQPAREPVDIGSYRGAAGLLEAFA